MQESRLQIDGKHEGNCRKPGKISKQVKEIYITPLAGLYKQACGRELLHI